MKSNQEQYEYYSKWFAVTLLASLILFAFSLLAPFILHLQFHTPRLFAFSIAAASCMYVGTIQHHYHKLVEQDTPDPGHEIIHMSLNDNNLVIIRKNGTIWRKTLGSTTWIQETNLPN